MNANGQKPIGMTFSKGSDFELHTFSIHSYKMRISDHTLNVTVIAFVGGSRMISISNEKKTNVKRTLKYNSWWEKRQCDNEILTYCSRIASSFFRLKFYRKTMHIQSISRSLFFQNRIPVDLHDFLSSSDCAFQMQSKTKKFNLIKIKFLHTKNPKNVDKMRVTTNRINKQMAFVDRKRRIASIFFVGAELPSSPWISTK